MNARDWRKASFARTKLGSNWPGNHLFRCHRCGALMRVEDCQGHLARCPAKKHEGK